MNTNLRIPFGLIVAGIALIFIIPGGCSSVSRFNTGDGTGVSLFSVVEQSEYGEYELTARQLDSELKSWEFSVNARRSTAKYDFTFVWEFGDGGTATGSDQTYQYTDAGTYLIKVTALDSRDATAFVLLLTIDIETASNHAPIADAGVDQTSNENALVFLYAGLSYDPDKDPMEYKWIQVSGIPVQIINATEPTANFVAPFVDLDSNFEFTVLVSDGTFSSQDNTLVHVLDVTGDVDDCIVSSTAWQSIPFVPQSGLYSAEFDVTPEGDQLDAIVALSNNTGTTFSEFSSLVRFNASGFIDVRDGGTYRSDVAVEYLNNVALHIRMLVNVPAHTYSVYVLPAGDINEVVLATDYSFRTEQNSVAKLENMGVWSGTGTLQVCNFTLGSGDVLSASAGNDKTIVAGESVALDGSAGGGSGSYTYFWSPSTGLSDVQAAQPTASPSTTTTYLLTVTDSNNLSAKDAVTVIVSESQIKSGFTDSITQWGITWEFDGNYEFGQYVNGDYWVVGPVSIASINPSPGNGRSGSMINPSGSAQAFDDRIGYYDSTLGVSLPFTLIPNQSLISTISHTGSDRNTDLIGREISAAHSKLQSAAVLTCVGAAVPETDFRPPYIGISKPQFSSTTLQRNILPQLVSTEGNLSLIPNSGQTIAARYARIFERPWINFISDWQGRLSHPTENMPNYYRETYMLESDAALLLLCNIPEHELLLINFIQHGIDNYHTALTGVSDRTMSKWPILFAGAMLNDNGMKTINYRGFREESQTYYGTGWTGATVLWRQKVLYPHEHIHPTSWDTIDLDAGGGIKMEQYRRGSASWIWVGTALAAQIMSPHISFGHPAFLDYEDRWMNEADVQNLATLESMFGNIFYYGGGSTGNTFTKNMWLAYR